LLRFRRSSVSYAKETAGKIYGLDVQPIALGMAKTIVVGYTLISAVQVLIVGGRILLLKRLVWEC